MDQHQPFHHHQQQQRFPTAARSVSPEPMNEQPTSSFAASAPAASSSSFRPLPPTANFRSQRITSPLSAASSGAGAYSGAAPPLLLQPPTSAAPSSFFGNMAAATTSLEQQQKLPPSSSAAPSQPDDAMTMAQKRDAIGTIPLLPSFHIKERTAIKIAETTLPANALLDRILEYLREHSISYECEPNTGCLECVASTDDVVGFVIQLWRAQENGEKIFWMEAQRREGCGIAMNAIRRSLIRHVQGAGNSNGSFNQNSNDVNMLSNNNSNHSATRRASVLGRRSHHDLMGLCPSSPTRDTNNHHHHHSSPQQNKRQRSLSPRSRTSNNGRLNCQDALSMSLRLLNSASPEQHKLGLKSLVIVTDPTLVDPKDAAYAARVLILGEGQMGVPLQFYLARILQQVHPKKDLYRHNRGMASLAARLYHLTLHVLANALEVLENTAVTEPINLACPLWQVTMECLLYSMDNAVKSPHEGTLAVKCIRHLLPATKRAVAFAQQQQQHQYLGLNLHAMHASTTRALQFGKSHHKSLEQESQRLLGSFANATAA